MMTSTLPPPPEDDTVMINHYNLQQHHGNTTTTATTTYEHADVMLTAVVVATTDIDDPNNVTMITANHSSLSNNSIGFNNDNIVRIIDDDDHQQQQNDSGGDLIKETYDDDGERSVSSLSLFLMQPHDDDNENHKSNKPSNNNVNEGNNSLKGILDNQQQQQDGQQKRFCFYNAEDFVIHNNNDTNQDTIKMTTTTTEASSIPLINENNNNNIRSDPPTTTTTKITKPDQSSPTEFTDHNKKNTTGPTIPLEAILHNSDGGEDVLPDNIDNHNNIDSLEILKSLKEHEQQRLEILSGSGVHSINNNSTNRSKGNNNHHRNNYHNHQHNHYASSSSTHSSSTRYHASNSTSYDNNNNNASDSNTTTYNPYEDAIKEALLLLRKHRPSEQNHSSSYGIHHNRFGQQQQQQTDIRNVSSSTDKSSDQQNPQGYYISTTSDSSVLDAIGNYPTTNQLRIDTSTDAMTPGSINSAVAVDGHYVFNPTSNNSNNCTNPRDFLDPVFTSKSASTVPNNTFGNIPDTPNSDITTTSSAVILGDAYQTEIEVRRRQRQERMAKYASRLAELKQQEENDNNGNMIPNNRQHRTTTEGKGDPYTRNESITSTTTATENLINQSQVSHDDYPDTSVEYDEDNIKTHVDADNVISKRSSPSDIIIPRTSPDIMTSTNLLVANDFEYNRHSYSNSLPTPDASISSYVSQNEREIQKGVERVLLAILERANSNSRGGGRSTSSSSTTRRNRYEQQPSYSENDRYHDEVESILHPQNPMTDIIANSAPTLPSQQIASTLLHNSNNIEEKKSANLTDDVYGHPTSSSSSTPYQHDTMNQKNQYYNPDETLEDRNLRIDDPLTSQQQDDPLLAALTDLFRPSLRDGSSVVPSSSNEEQQIMLPPSSHHFFSSNPSNNRQLTKMMINAEGEYNMTGLDDEKYIPSNELTMRSVSVSYANVDDDVHTDRNDGLDASGKVVVQDSFLLDTVSGEVEAVHSGGAVSSSRDAMPSGAVSPGDAISDNEYIHDDYEDEDDVNFHLGGVQSHEANMLNHLDETVDDIVFTIGSNDSTYSAAYDNDPNYVQMVVSDDDNLVVSLKEIRSNNEQSLSTDRYQTIHDDTIVTRRHLDDFDSRGEQLVDDRLDEEQTQPHDNGDYDSHSAIPSSENEEEEQQDDAGNHSYSGVLGPLSKRPGGTTGVVLENSDSLSSSTSSASSATTSSSSEYDDEDESIDSDSKGHKSSSRRSPSNSTPSIFQSLSAAVSLVTGVTSYDENNNKSTTSIPQALTSAGSSQVDKYYFRNTDSKSDDDENDFHQGNVDGISHHNSVESDENSEDSESYDLMRSLCAHLLPFGIESLMNKRNNYHSRRLLEPLPGWDSRNPDEPGYRIVRLNKYQLHRVQTAYDKMIDYVRNSSHRNLLSSRRSLNHPIIDDDEVLDAEAFERDLQVAEDLLDEEELRLITNNTAELPHETANLLNKSQNVPTEEVLDDVKNKVILQESKSVIDEYESSHHDDELTTEKEEEDIALSDSDMHLANFHGVRSVGKGEMGELEYFSLPIIFKSHVTGFEPTKDLVLEPGNVIAGQYLVEGVLGTAAFSTAYKCINLNADPEDDHERYVCLKVIKNTKDFFDQSLDEIKILELLRQTGKCHQMNLIEMKTFFYNREHLIIVTELLRQNLFEFNKFIIDSGEEQYFNIQRLSYVTRQCLIGLQFVHELGLVHSDIKPENILLASYSRSLIKIIDFGSSCWLTDRQSSYIQSRSYRAPEVVLGLPYDGRIDIWSLGCVVAEMFTGEVLFQNDSVVSMLCRIEAICGTFPKHMILNGRQSTRFFTKCGLLYEKVLSDERRRRRHDDDEDDKGGEDSFHSDDDDVNDDDDLSVSDDDDDDDDHHRKKDKKKSSKLTYIDIFQPKKTTLTERLGLVHPPPVSSSSNQNRTIVEANSVDCSPTFFIDKILFPETNNDKTNIIDDGTTVKDDGGGALLSESSSNISRTATSSGTPSVGYMQKIFIDFVRQLLIIDPDLRLTAKQALEHPFMLYAKTLKEHDVRYPSVTK